MVRVGPRPGGAPPPDGASGPAAPPGAAASVSGVETRLANAGGVPPVLPVDRGVRPEEVDPGLPALGPDDFAPTSGWAAGVESAFLETGAATTPATTMVSAATPATTAAPPGARGRGEPRPPR